MKTAWTQYIRILTQSCFFYAENLCNHAVHPLCAELRLAVDKGTRPMWDSVQSRLVKAAELCYCPSL